MEPIPYSTGVDPFNPGQIETQVLLGGQIGFELLGQFVEAAVLIDNSTQGDDNVFSRAIEKDRQFGILEKQF
jgi:hypothetical protein